MFPGGWWKVPEIDEIYLWIDVDVLFVDHGHPELC